MSRVRLPEPVHVGAAVKLGLEPTVDGPVGLPLLWQDVLDGVAAAGDRRVVVAAAQVVLDGLEQHPQPAAGEAAVGVLGGEQACGSPRPRASRWWRQVRLVR